MRLANQQSPALLKRIDRPAIWRIPRVLSLSLIFLAGCAGGAPGISGVTNFFTGAAPTPNPTATPNPTVTPTPIATPVAGETSGHPGKKTARQARAASENAAAASKEAANASAAAALASKQAAIASKQAASVANQVEGSGPVSADVSLEGNPGAAVASTPPAAVRTRETPSSSPSAEAAEVSVASVARTTPTLSSSALESSVPSDEGNPAKAAKLIEDIDKTEKRVDRKNLSADDSQRDILAQKLLQEAKKALADRDSVAALSLATKASTLLSPLPKLADSAFPSAP